MSAQPDISAAQWRERAAALKPRSQVFIDGRFVPAANGATFDNINPATGRSLAPVAAGEQLDIDRAVASARAAFRRGSWSQQPPEGAQEGAAASLPSSCSRTAKSWRCSRRSTWASPSPTA